MEHDPNGSGPSPTQPLAEFYREQFPLVVSYLLKLGADRAEAEDAVQNAMEMLVRHPEGIRSRAAWVRVVARNNWIRAMRRHMKAMPAGVACNDVEREGGRSPSNTDPADVIRQITEQEDAVRMIRSLPPTQREILALAFDGYRPAEIAEITGSNSSAVRANLAHARRRLGRLLTDRQALRTLGTAA
ncbi:sigma-70 family RNA polymerase sigma factor [Dactylosporangium sp. NPDC050688]|uniref:RNA polymerase sigma factor n=1 Tax=Dactylosporangium sp. NPDC050688 TaxID=3157217 RepID=UPI00340D642C